MTKADYEAAARIVLKYAAAVETTLYWKMTTAEARGAIAEARAVAAVLTAAAEAAS